MEGMKRRALDSKRVLQESTKRCLILKKIRKTCIKVPWSEQEKKCHFTPFSKTFTTLKKSQIRNSVIVIWK